MFQTDVVFSAFFHSASIYVALKPKNVEVTDGDATLVSTRPSLLWCWRPSPATASGCQGRSLNRLCLLLYTGDPVSGPVLLLVLSPCRNSLPPDTHPLSEEHQSMLDGSVCKLYSTFTSKGHLCIQDSTWKTHWQCPMNTFFGLL